MRDYNKGKKYIILKKSNHDGIKILSNPGLFIKMGSNGIVKEFNSKKRQKFIEKNYLKNILMIGFTYIQFTHIVIFQYCKLLKIY